MSAREFVLTLTSVLLIACSQVMFKVAARNLTSASFGWDALSQWLTPSMLAAVLLSFVATILWLVVLRTASLGLAYPLYALTFVLVPMLDWLIFRSPLSWYTLAGGAAIALGVGLIARQ
jgi:drug/metabolite transporter (DMT)-like permease